MYYNVTKLKKRILINFFLIMFYDMYTNVSHSLITTNVKEILHYTVITSENKQID
jgi:hypothetical protein